MKERTSCFVGVMCRFTKCEISVVLQSLPTPRIYFSLFVDVEHSFSYVRQILWVGIVYTAGSICPSPSGNLPPISSISIDEYLSVSSVACAVCGGTPFQHHIRIMRANPGIHCLGDFFACITTNLREQHDNEKE